MVLIARSVLLGCTVAGAAVLSVTAREASPRSAMPIVGPSGNSPIQPGGPAVLPDTQSETGRSVCGGFSAEGRYQNLPVMWSFRLCESAAHEYDVQLRFRNVSAREVRFEYRVWSERPGACDDSAGRSLEGEQRLTPLLEREKELRPGEGDEWPYAGGVVPRREYRGEIWSCALAKR